MLKSKSLPILAGAAAVLLLSGVAHANIVLSPGPTPADSFVSLGAQGFGNDPRLLTEQTHPFENGSVAPDAAGNPVVSGDAIANNGGNKSNTPTISALGWTSGAQVGIGFNTDQTGGASTGLTLDTLVLRIYNGTTVVGTFSLANHVDFTAADLALQQGNGFAVFNFGLDSTEQTTFNNILLTAGSSGFRAGLESAMGCNTTNFPNCAFPSNDGPDSFIGFAQAAVPAPVIGQGLFVLLAVGGVLFGSKLLENLKKHNLHAA